MQKIGFCKKCRKPFIALAVVLSVFLSSAVICTPTLATTYTSTITTGGGLVLNGSGAGNGTSIGTDSVNVTTTCHAGYNLTISTSTADNNLYLDGDDTNNASGEYFSPADGTSTLPAVKNRWGYYYSSSTPSVTPTAATVFQAVPAFGSTPAVLRTTAETASESDIDDTFPVYYGVSMDTSIQPGAYKMVKDSHDVDGAIVYRVTMDSSCADSAVITFNENTDGEGAEGDDATIANMPTTSDNTTDTEHNTITLSDKRPTRSGYQFKEWNTSADGTGDYYYVGETVPMGGDGLSGFVTLYAIWVPDCSSNAICYDGNHADAGAMNAQAELTASSTIALIPSNFSRSGYGFTGWNTEADGTGTQYGPNQNFTMPSTGGVNLYAQWLAPSGTIQGFSSSNIASNMNTGDVLALEDDRDGEVYMVAKLADGNIWITENLRLLPNTATITNRNTNHPTNDFISNAPSSSSSTSQCFGDNATCVNQINYNAHNLNRNLTPAYDGNTNSTYWYSYGVMYNWYTATAGNGTYELTSTSAAGDLCPAGWHLPSGGASGEWGVLASNMPGNNGTAKSASLRSYPNNFLYSGDYNPSKDIPDGVGKQGRFWSTTPVSSNIKNAYRMGYNSTEVTAATSNSWNKWDNFAIRCIYQGGNVPYSDVEVDFEGTGITSLTFTSQGQDTEIATPQSPTISLAENVTYDVAATLTSGYEVASWATSSGGTLGNSTTTNPAPSTNTYTITSDATLTVTGQLTPIYTVTATLGEHVSSISFMSSDYGTETITPASPSCSVNQDNTYTCTVNLRRGVEYTISGTYESGYGFDAWATGAGGTLGDATSYVTTYTITSATTLSLTAKEAEDMTYTLIYHAGSGTDAPEQETITSQNPSESFTITNSTPIYYGYTFTGWSETADANNNGTAVDYVSGDTITITGTSLTNTKTLYPVYQAIATCPANNICYYDNGADVNGGGRGTMTNQSSNTTKLIPSNFSRTGYGFAGWTTAENATPFGPNATIDSSLVSPGLVLYAKWVKSEGDLQTWRGCNAMTENQVIALTDTRDNNVYAVAKLADGNCWTIENLRLDPGLATITAQNTHNPTSTFITESTTNDGSGNPVSLSTDTLCSTDDDSNCINSIQYNASSINRSLTPNKSASSSSWYSYGIYYNWYTATAGNGVMTTASGANVSGDICPKNWHLPTSTNSGEWAALNRVVNGGVSNADAGLRTYPVNLIWSGDYSTGRTSGYVNGRYWSSTGFDASNAYRMGHQESGSKGATPSGNYRKWDGFAVRCIRDEVTAEYSDLTVTLPQNVESITFTHPQYGTETATASDPVVSLAQDTSYTMTATFATGYELGSWTAGANATIADSTANPTTIIITDDSTLTLTTSEIPTYTVTVSLDSGSTSVTFTNASYPAQTVTTTGSTVSLRRGVEYTITGTFDTANGYVFDSWTAGSGSTLGATNQNPTTYVITSASTLSLTSKQKTGQTTLLPGHELNAKMKTLAEGKSTEYNDDSSKIKSLRMADSLPSGFTPSSANTVSVSGSEKPIYIFFDNTADAGIMYFYTDAKDIYMNQDSSYAFSGNTALTNIDGASSWNTSSVTNMFAMFGSASSLTNIDGARNWDTSSVTDMSWMFDGTSSLTNIDGASSWNTSSVTNMSYMFYVSTLTNIDGAINWNTSSVTNMSHMFDYAGILTNIDGAINWNTSSVTNMGSMFKHTSSLTNIDGAANWDVSSVTDMSDMFNNASSLTNIDGAANWGVSNVTNMSYMFNYASSLTNIDGASSWDTSSVTNMSSMFAYAYALTNIDGASSWDTSSVTNMSYMFNSAESLTNIDGASSWDTSNITNMSRMFYGTYALTNASGANNWDVRSVTATAGSTSSSSNSFYYMFHYAGGSSSNPTHPTFTTRSGTWNSEGTFIPGDTTPVPITTTVTFDSHIGNIKFYGVFPGSSSNTTQTISTSGSTISLNSSNSYRITATLDSGYELALWNPGEHGKIPARRITLNTREGGSTYFTPTGDTTLTATSQLVPSDVTTTVNMDSNITRVSFCNDKYNTYNSSTQTYDCTIATSNGSTVTLKQGATYRVTTATKQGYEVSSYTTTGATITSTTGPHTDFTPSGNSSLTITSTTNAPTHTVTVNMDSNVSYVTFTNPDWPTRVAIRNGFTVDLRDNTPYTATAYTKDGYILSSWTAGANATLGSTTTNPTTLTVTGTTTLSATSQQIPSYNVTVTLDTDTTSVGFYNATYGTQNITTSGDTASLRSGVEYTITATTANGYEFSSWTAGANATISSTNTNPTTLTVTGTTTLSVTSREEGTGPQPATAGCINYFANASDANGTMGCQSASDGQPLALLASNFSRTGYGFAGWSDSYDYATNPNAHFYGPQETITVPTGTTANGLSLYAVWVKSQGSIQDQSKVASVCSSLTTAPTDGTANLSSVSALTDQRDNNTYAIAKLADGKCWMIENLRLESTAAHNSDGTLAQGYGTSATYGNFGGLATAESANFTNSTTANSLYYSGAQSGDATINIGTTDSSGYRMPRYNNTNTSTRASNPTINSASMYSYGNYYTWHAAIADLTYSGTDNQSTTETSLCPTGWHLPKGGNNQNTANNEFLAFSEALIGAKPANYNSSTYPYYVGTSEEILLDRKITSYPNNFLRSGSFSDSSTNGRGAVGYYWTSTTIVGHIGYTLYMGTANGVYPGTNGAGKDAGRSIRCINGPSTLSNETVTVSLDGNVTSVIFTNASYPAQTVTTNGSTVNLYPNTSYTITATTANGYEFNSWTAGANATLGSTTANPTTLTITGSTTLSVTSEQKAGSTTLLPGNSLNTKMKTLAEGASTSYTSSSSKIKALRMSDTLPAEFIPSTTNTVSLYPNEKPIYIFFDNTNDAGIMYFYTEAKDIYMHPDSSFAFYYDTALVDISALSNWNTSNVTTMEAMFFSTSALTNIDPLSNWDTSNVTDMSVMFSGASSLTNIDGASDWKTDSVTDMSCMFQDASSLTNIDGASDWKTDSVTDMSSLFLRAYALTNIDGASSWNTGSVTDMSLMFQNASSLTDIDALSNWNTGSVTNMSNMFLSASALTSIDGASSWNTSNVTDMNSMFTFTSSLTDASAINDWDIRAVVAKAGSSDSVNNKFRTMFYQSGGSLISAYHPEFTKRQGIWDSNGTFIPNNATIPSSDAAYVTVSFGEHVRSVGFYNSTFGTSQATPANPTIRIANNTEYIISSSYDSGYDITSWSTTSTGTLGSINSRATTYTVTADATLSITATSNTKLYMQDFTKEDCNSLKIGETLTLYDKRDEATYTITRTGDSLCWMTSDLHLGSTTSTTTLTNEDTDITASTFVLPEVETSSNKTQWGTTNSTSGLDVAHAYQYSSTKNLYNYYAASAGTTYSTLNPTTSICPKGWKLPTRAQANAYLSVLGESNGTTNLAIVTEEPLSFTGGLYDTDKTAYTNKAYWVADGWQNSSSGVYFGYHFGVQNISNESQIRTSYGYQKMVGLGIRCVHASDKLAGFTINLDANGGSVNPHTLFGTITQIMSNLPTPTREGFNFEGWYASAAGGEEINSTNIRTGTSTYYAKWSTSVPVNFDNGISRVVISDGINSQTISSSGDTATLELNVEYTITATTANGYEFNSWTAGSGATLGSTTANPTTLTITGASTLSATSKVYAPEPQPATAGCINYFANASDAVGTMGCQSATDGNSIDLLASNFSRTGYGFAGWSDSYGYATNLNAKFYGPMETITVPEGTTANGLSLYAVWVKSEGSIQDQSKVASVCNSLITAPTDGTANLSSVSALTDQRDNNTYAIAKLADGNCWMIENLRLDSTAAHNSDGTLAQGYGTSSTYGNFGGLANAESANFTDSTTTNSLYYSGTQSGDATINIGTRNNPGYRMPRYNNFNTSTRASSPTSNDNNIYSYGNYYTWHAAIADLTYNGTNNQSTTGTSLCPTGWHLPTGGMAYASGSTNGVNVTGDTSTFREFYNLGYKTMDEVKTAYEDRSNSGYAYYSSNTTNTAGKTATAALRSFPNNFLYSGYFNTSSADNRGSYGYYWASTARNNYNSFNLRLYSSSVLPGTDYDSKGRGQSIRCTVGA